MLREIVLDTETTGLDAKTGDRLVELGCVEIINRIPTGVEFHKFICPEDKLVHPDAERIHGLSNDFLKDKPKFRDIVAEFLAFIGDAPLVIHNASFDAGFLNAELARVKQPLIGTERLVDTLAIARRKHPAGPNSLDALCKRYSVDNSKRTKHGALVDSLLLAGVYVELLGERQATLGLAAKTENRELTPGRQRATNARSRPTALPSRVTPDGETAHAVFVGELGPHAIWQRYAKQADTK